MDDLREHPPARATAQAAPSPQPWRACEHRVCVEVAGDLLQQAYRDGTAHGRELGLAQARAEQLEVLELEHLDRLARAVDRAPSQLELVALRYPDAGAGACERRRRAGAQAVRVWSGWLGGEPA